MLKQNWRKTEKVKEKKKLVWECVHNKTIVPTNTFCIVENIHKYTAISTPKYRDADNHSPTRQMWVEFRIGE
jgi:hypothetical protein